MEELTNANPFLRAILQTEELCVQLLVVGMHRTNSKSRGVNSGEREDDLGEAGRVDLGRPDLVAGSTARVPGERQRDSRSQMI